MLLLLNGKKWFVLVFLALTLTHFENERLFIITFDFPPHTVFNNEINLLQQISFSTNTRKTFSEEIYDIFLYISCDIKYDECK